MKREIIECIDKLDQAVAQQKALLDMLTAYFMAGEHDVPLSNEALSTYSSMARDLTDVIEAESKRLQSLKKPLAVA